MALKTEDIQTRLEKHFQDSISNFRMEYDILTLEVLPDSVSVLIRFMREDEELGFNFLTDLCAVHYPDNEPD